jgi:hypothetical protein
MFEKNVRDRFTPGRMLAKAASNPFSAEKPT